MRRLAAALLLFASTLVAQTPPTTAAAPVDPLGRSTPRKAIYNFLEACRSENLVRASQYLDLSRIKSQGRTVQGPALAKNLCDLLNRDPQFEVDELNNTLLGASDDGLPADLDNLVTIQVSGQPVRLHMQREGLNSSQVWLVSPDSVVRIPESEQPSAQSAVEKRLPRPLVAIELLGTPLWVWLALLCWQCSSHWFRGCCRESG